MVITTNVGISELVITTNVRVGISELVFQQKNVITTKEEVKRHGKIRTICNMYYAKVICMYYVKRFELGCVIAAAAAFVVAPCGRCC